MSSTDPAAPPRATPASPGPSTAGADLLIVGGRVFRGFGPGAEAPLGSALGDRPEGSPTAVAVRDGRIAFVGGDEEALGTWRGPATELVGARGGLILAGFDDAHSHLLGGARSLDQVDLFGLDRLEAIQAAVRTAAEADPDAPWVVGRGWLYVPFPGGLPTREQLDTVVPDRPAFLTGYDGHTAWANSAALRAAGIDRETPDPPNGEIVRDPSSGEPTGALKEAAQALVERVLPVQSREADLAALRRTFGLFHRLGLTAAQDAWVTVDEIAVYRELAEAGQLTIRLRLALAMESTQTLAAWRDRLETYAEAIRPLEGGRWLRAGILKGFVDGVVESRTAAMLEPYEGSDSRGTPGYEPDQLDAFVAEADRRGWQVELHAIGDRGVRMALDAHERAALANGPWRGGIPRRHRVEHIETISAADIARFGRLGVIASMQPYHADPSPNQISLWAGNIGPERASRAWPWRSIRAAGGTIAFGSDWPVVPFDPFIALNGAVTRQTVEGSPAGGWLPEERLGLPEALSAYTLGSATAAFAEDRRGTIAPGRSADLIVLDRDLLADGPSAIIGTQVALTVVDGRVVHRAAG